MSDETEDKVIVWSPTAPDPVMMGLLTSVLEINDNCVRVIAQIVNMNERIMKGTILQDEDLGEQPPSLDKDD